VSITIKFDPWRTFHARKRKNGIRNWLRDIGYASENAFKNPMQNYPPASTPGEYPAIRTGKLKGSIRSEVRGETSVTIGSNMFYSIFLRMGTSKMARRKMSDNALQEGRRFVGPPRRWVEWTRG
jgi:hypothetical protein